MPNWAAMARLRVCRCTRQPPLVAGLGVAQQPLGTTRLGVFGQAAHGQIGLLVVGTRHVAQQVAHVCGAG